MLPHPETDAIIDAKECARCDSLKRLGDISEVRLRVGGNAVFICKGCKKREQSAPVLLGYECPGWKYGREGYRCPRLRFSDYLPPIAKLAGTYDIVFYAADQAFGPRYHRKTNGSMSLNLGGGDELRGDHLLCGTIEMDRMMAISDTPWIDRFSFVQDETDELSFPGFETGACMSYHGRHFPDLVHNQRDVSLLRGQMRVVLKRTAVRYRPDAKVVHRVKQRPITFNNNTHAEQILAEFTNSIMSWLSANLGIPDLAASHICEYWSTRPPPLFFFEEGDLCLTTMWPRKGYMYDDVATMIVARRRPFCI